MVVSKLDKCKCYFTLSTTSCTVRFGAQKITSWLFVMTHNIPEQSDWCDNMPIYSCDYAPGLQVNVSRPYFSMRSQGAREKFGVRGQDYSSTCSPVTVVSNCYIYQPILHVHVC